MLRFLSLVSLLLVTSSLRAESVPEFSLDYANEHATHIVVVDASGNVLESWRGDLKAGDTVPFPADAKPRAVVEIKDVLVSKVKEVTSRRRVLFLIRDKAKNNADAAVTFTPAGYLEAKQHFATVWVEADECFAIYQWMNPGPGAHLHTMNLHEAALKKMVTESKK